MLQRTHQVFNTTLDSMTVLDPLTMLPVPPDGVTMGEVLKLRTIYCINFIMCWLGYDSRQYCDERIFEE